MVSARSAYQSVIGTAMPSQIAVTMVSRIATARIRPRRPSGKSPILISHGMGRSGADPAGQPTHGNARSTGAPGKVDRATRRAAVGAEQDRRRSRCDAGNCLAATAGSGLHRAATPLRPHRSGRQRAFAAIARERATEACQERPARCQLADPPQPPAGRRTRQHQTGDQPENRPDHHLDQRVSRMWCSRKSGCRQDRSSSTWRASSAAMMPAMAAPMTTVMAGTSNATSR